MNNKRKAKKILRAFGKETYKARIAYVDSFLPEKVSYVRSISYRHALRRAAIVALVLIMIMALAVSAYAAVKHYLNYTKVVHSDNDEYVLNDNSSNKLSVETIELTYVPEGYELEYYDYDQQFDEKTWVFARTNGESLIIILSTDLDRFNIDNDRSVSEQITVGNLEGIKYSFDGEILCVFQYENMVIRVISTLDDNEIVRLINGLNLS